MKCVKLNNGVKMPTLGLGVFTFSSEDAEKAVENALRSGYHLIDTANSYANERATGRGIKNSGVKREEVFISSKLWPSEYENVNAVDETLARLGIEYIDLLFLHQPAGNYLNGYKMIEQAVKDGKVRAIGLSNFEGEYFDDILSHCEIKPQVMQVECHPYYPQVELREKQLLPNDIKLMSWFPLGHGDKSLVNEPVIVKLAEKYGKSPAQIILHWHTQMDFIVIPGSRSPEHIKENIDIFDFELTNEEMAEIAKLNSNTRYYYRDPENLKNWVNVKPQWEEE